MRRNVNVRLARSVVVGFCSGSQRLAERPCEGFYQREMRKGFELILKLSDFMKNSLEFYPDSPDRWRGWLLKQLDQNK